MDLNETVALKVEKPKISIENLTFHFDDKALKILQGGNYSFLKFDVELIEENCARIYNPIISPQVNPPKNSESSSESSKIFLDITEPLAVTVEITSSFSDNFPQTEKIEITGAGWLRKSLICKNIEPKIINVC